MFIDGLWVSGMTLHIHRDGAPIPKEMQDVYIRLQLTPMQMQAVAILLGLGYRNGELMYYKDDDLNHNILRDDGLGFPVDYRMYTDYVKQNRRCVVIADSIHNSHSLDDAVMTRKSDNSCNMDDFESEMYDGDIEYGEFDDDDYY